MSEYVDKPIPDDSQLAKVAALAKEFAQYDFEIKKLEIKLATLKRSFEQIATVELPNAMVSIGLREFVLKNGYRIKIEPIFNVRLTKANMDRADAWLQEHGHSGMIKRKLEVDLNGIESDGIEDLKREIEFEGFTYEEVKNIHWATLQSWANEMNESGEVIPEEIFSVFRGNRTVITE